MPRNDPSQILRGQMYYADLDPVIGSEQGGSRPVLIIQNNAGNRYSPTVIVAPITSQMKKRQMLTHIGIPPCYGLPERSMVLLEQIRTIDKRRLDNYLGCLDDDIMDCIDRAICISVGLEKGPGATQLKESGVPEGLDEVTLCLCPTCASQFFNSPDHIIRRISPETEPNDTCAYCDVRLGYTYRVIPRRKRLGDDRP